MKREQRQLPKGIESHDTMFAISSTSLLIAQQCPLVSDVMMSHDRHMVIPNYLVLVPISVWGTLASLVTYGLQSQDSNMFTG